MVNNQLVFINSRNRVSGTPYEFILDFNNGLLKCEKNSLMRLTVQEATINRSWYSVQAGQNTFNIVDNNNATTVITLPPAYYNAIDIRTTLSGLLPSGWSVLYDRKTNKFSFTRPNDGIPFYKFIFKDNLSDVLGFTQTEQPTFTTSTQTIESTKPVRVNEENALCIHTDLGRSKNSSVDNHNPNYKSFRESTLLCKIPITCPPFDNIVYNDQSSLFQFDLTAPNITSIRVWITDENDRVIQLPYDWSMIWRIEHINKNDANRDAIEDIRDYLKLIVLSNEKLISP